MDENKKLMNDAGDHMNKIEGKSCSYRFEDCMAGFFSISIMLIMILNLFS
ncbi:hypothetical protein [Robertmurraya massiliosenegalensis]|nr:hypothetical protein [Robertmurraya massiliosenegalensis]